MFIPIFVVGSERHVCKVKKRIMAVQGHPKLLILVPIENAYAVSY